jgi:sugar O-acyltransferase (sialic acid O-acetyltransferase NeuD family)
MKKNLIIIGAGKFGREVYAWARQSREHGRSWDIKGFLDCRPEILNGRKYDVPIISSTENYSPQSDDLFVCSIAEPNLKKTLCEIIQGRGGEFCNIVHFTVVMGENVRLGTGIILCPYSVISCDAAIGNFVSINLHTAVGHDVTIGDYCQINPHTTIGGGAVVKNGVTIGSNACILPDAVVEEGSVVGAGSVVLRRAPPHQTVFGVPAKPVPLPASPNISLRKENL